MNFQPMLAGKLSDFDKLRFPLVAQPKYDGIRCTVTTQLGPVTRTLKKIPNHFIRNHLAHNAYWYQDGEIITYTDGVMDPLDVIQSKVMTREGEPNFVFHAFDHIERPTAPYDYRYRDIRETGYARKVDYNTINSLVDLLDYENMLVTDGWEGVILRDPSAPYKFGRSTENEGILLKMKRFLDTEAVVVGFIEKMINTNEQVRDERGYAKRSSAKAGKVPADTLGALLCRWDTGVEFEIGTGFDDALRRAIWDNQEDWLEAVVTFKYQRTGPKGKPLLPVYQSRRREFEH